MESGSQSKNVIENVESQNTQKDGILEILEKTLDPNKYATKKTIAQGLLDVALLTANASQLKYILQVGPKHEFYTLMLSLIIVSIILQVVVGLLCLSLHLLRDCRLHLEAYHRSAVWLNHTTIILAFIITAINLLISCFDPTRPSNLVTGGVVSILVYLKMDHTQNHEQNQVAWILNHINLGLITSAMFCDIIKMNFGLDPAILQGTLCIFLGTTVDINESEDHNKADKVNNVVVLVNFLLMGVNIVINTFDMRSSDSGT